MVLKFTLLGDGTSDAALVPIIERVIEEALPDFAFRVEFASNLGAIGSNLSTRIAAVMKRYPCEILLVHRDAENQHVDARLEEIRNASQGLSTAIVAVVPVRMTEAWLLLDGDAIRSASGNPYGSTPLSIPRANQIENIPNPKQLLFELLTSASELRGRRRASFNPREHVRRVAELVSNHDLLRQLPSFQRFESELIAATGTFTQS